MDGLSGGDIFKLVSKLSRKTQMYLNEELKPFGLTSGQMPFLMITCEKESMPQNKFCEILDMDKSTVAKMLAKLEDEGLVVRRPNQNDSRAANVLPTKKAFSLYPALKQIGEKWAGLLSAGLTQVEADIFFELLQKVTKNAVDHFSIT